MTFSSSARRGLAALVMILGCVAPAGAAPLAPALSVQAPMTSRPAPPPATAAATFDPPPALALQVAARVAAEWGVAPEATVLEWGMARSLESAAGDMPFRLVGQGVGGWWTVIFEPPSRPQAAVRMRAGVTDTVYRAARPLPAGTRLADSDMKGVAEVVWGPPLGAEQRPGIGWEVRRPLMNGAALRPPAVAPPLMVAAGEPVAFEWLQGGVRVSVTGIALHAARLGETVRARLEARGERLAGVVTGPGTATIRGGIR